MVDIVAPHERSRLMARIKAKNTLPEYVIRRLLHKAGYRYRLHVRNIPGRPDIVLKKLNTLMFVNGCFWHAHDCGWARFPKSNRRFWNAKLKGNRLRDELNIEKCRQLGWRVLVVWECALYGSGRLSDSRLSREIIVWLEREVKRPSVKQIKGRKAA